MPAAQLATPPMSARGRHQRPAGAAAATPPLTSHASRRSVDGEEKGPAATPGDKDKGKGRMESAGGKDGDEPALPVSNTASEGGGGGGGGGGVGASGGREGKSKTTSSSNDYSGGRDRGKPSVPAPFELPEMGAAGEGGRSTKDDPAFMKTFFRNSRLHFIGVG